MIAKKQRINRFTFAELEMIISALLDYLNLGVITAQDNRICNNALAKAKRRRYHA